MIEILFIIFFVLSVLHCVYETCVLPELRLGFVYGLFKLRDELRSAKLANEITDIDAYRVLQDSLNNGINSVFIADYLLLSEVQHVIKRDKELAEKIAHRIAVLDSTEDPVIIKIRKQSRKVLLMAVGAGSGAAIPYVFPIFLFVCFCKGIKASLKASLKASFAMPTPQFADATLSRSKSAPVLAIA